MTGICRKGGEANEKIMFVEIFALTLLLGSTSIVAVHNWTSSENFVIPSWGKMSNPSNSTLKKQKHILIGILKQLQIHLHKKVW